MSMWAFRLADAARNEGKEALQLPLPPLPDMARLSPGAMRKEIQRLQPGIPPESAARQAEEISGLIHRVGVEDIVVFFSENAEENKVWFAQCIAPVYWQGQGDNGDYFLPLHWFEKQETRQAFSRFPSFFRQHGAPLYEISDNAARASVRDRLPLHTSRFRRIRWLLVVIGMINALIFMLHLIHNR